MNDTKPETNASDISDQKNPIVTCARCKREHEGFTHDQADGCAADIMKTGIYGHYGSAEADMTELHFAPNHPDVPKGLEGGQMCDLCIIELRDKGALINPRFCGPSSEETEPRTQPFSETGYLLMQMENDDD